MSSENENEGADELTLAAESVANSFVNLTTEMPQADIHELAKRLGEHFQAVLELMVDGSTFKHLLVIPPYGEPSWSKDGPIEV